jgi:hypothetical protein
MAGKVKTWVWVVIAIVVIGALGLIAVAGAGIYFFSRHIDARKTSPEAAIHAFDEVKNRLGNQKPLIELDEHGRYLRTDTDRTPPAGAQPPESLHVMAFEPHEGEDGRMVRVNIPFWLVRMKMRGTTIDFNGNRLDLEDLKLTVEDLERYGPTVIVDHQSPTGERVLVWSQ